MQKDSTPLKSCISRYPYSVEQSPLVIAHRGYCSLFPENTLESIEAALYKSDLVEFDIMLTQDNQIVIFHDRGMKKLTNIQEFQELAPLKSERNYDEHHDDKVPKSDWWINHMNYSDLKMLQVKQTFQQRPWYPNLQFKIPTFQQTLKRHLELKCTRLSSNNAGYLIELKSLHAQKDDQRDIQLVNALSKCLLELGLNSIQHCKQKHFPIVLQSFNHKILQELSNSSLNLPIVHLLDDKLVLSAQFFDKHIFSKSIGIGITEKHATPQVKRLCEQRNLLVFYWTIRDDKSDKIPFALSNYQAVYNHLFDLKIEGIITQFPEKCHQYRSIHKLRSQLQH